MTDTFGEFKKRIETAPDVQYPGNTLDIVNELLAHPPTQFDDILEWVFEEHKGYVEPRALAGLTFVQRNPNKGMAVITRLINSSDPDDRDTAVTVLERYGIVNAFELAKPLLQDPYPYLQFEAAELLKDIFPEEVKTILKELANRDSEKSTRAAAEKLLYEMGQEI